MALPREVQTALVAFWYSSNALEGVKSPEDLKRLKYWHVEYQKSRSILIQWLDACYKMEVKQ
jgi:hypothetical protein